MPKLVSLLPPDLGDIQQTSVSYAISEADALRIVDAATGKTVSRIGGVFANQQGCWFLRANRERLRRYLAQNLVVRTGRRFTRYVEDDTGVTAFFEDGSQVRGSVLVGADGAYSSVRRQLLGTTHMPVLSSNIPMNGMCRLTQEEYKPLREAGGSIFICATPGVFFNIGTCSMEADGSSGWFYYGVAFRSEQPEADSGWVKEASADAQFEKCIQLTEPMAKWLTNIIRKAGPEGISLPPIKFIEYLPPNPEDFPTKGRVTILGDAAHTMIPLKGIGANTAILDACDLGSLIGEEVRLKGMNGADLASVLHEYHALMSPRGREAVLSSRAAGKDEAGMMIATKGRGVDSSSLNKGIQ